MRRRGNGEGSVIYNTKRQRFEGKVAYIDPVTGIKKRTSFSDIASGKAVLAKMAKFKKELEQGMVYPDNKMTLEMWLNSWLEDYKKNEVRPKTLERYYVSVKQHIVPYIGRYQLQYLTTDLLQRHFALLRSKGGEDKQGLSPRTVNTVRRLLIQSLEDAVNLGYLVKNCARRSKPMKTQRVDFMVLSHEAAKKLVAVAKAYNETAWIVVILALGTGMRLGEIFALSWDSIDLEKEKLAVVQSAVKMNHGTIVQKDVKTKSSRREIPLPKYVTEALREYKAWQEATIPHLPNYRDEGFLVTNNKGNILHPASFSYHVFKKILLERAGIPEKFRFHDLRHTHATWLLEAGVNTKVVSERLGHANIRITLDTYAHVLKSMQGEAVAALDRIHTESGDGKNADQGQADNRTDATAVLEVPDKPVGKELVNDGINAN